MRILLVLLLCLVGCVSNTRTVPNVLVDNGYEDYWEQDRFPLVIAISDQLDSQREKAIRDGVKRWNDTVGERVFVVYKISEDSGLYLDVQRKYGWTPFVFSKLNSTPTRKTLGLCYRWTISGSPGTLYASYCEIEKRMDPIKSYSFLVLVITHELGHVLGLAHDISKQSVMYEGSISKSRGIIEQRDAERVYRMVHGRVYPTKFSSDRKDIDVEVIEAFCPTY